jgi:uncharacterized protein (DUF302 family)
MSNPSPATIVEHLSPLPFNLTLESLDHVMMDHGMTIFARIDHAANAKAVGLSMPPATVLIYGKAEGGTPIMLAAPNAALDLPLRVLVREDRPGRTVVCFHPIAPQLEALGVEAAIAARLQPAQALLLQALED